jgi:hypothetical protein
MKFKLLMMPGLLVLNLFSVGANASTFLPLTVTTGSGNNITYNGASYHFEPSTTPPIIGVYGWDGGNIENQNEENIGNIINDTFKIKAEFKEKGDFDDKKKDDSDDKKKDDSDDKKKDDSDDKKKDDSDDKKNGGLDNDDSTDLQSIATSDPYNYLAVHVGGGELLFRFYDTFNGPFKIQKTDGTGGGLSNYRSYLSPEIHAPTATPVPAAVWLFGSGLVGLIGIRRKSKTALSA